MKSFLKENMVLVAGIALPLLLTLFFFAATQMDKINAEPPRYSFIFATNYYENSRAYPYRFIVEDDQLRFVYSPPEDKDVYYNRTKPRLYVYDPVAQTSREIALPNIEDREEKVEVALEDIRAGKLSSLKKSPDGFVFEYDYRGGGNLMTEIFGGGYRSRSQLVLRKDGYSVRVPNADRYNSQFIGWIVEPVGGSDEQ